MGIKAVIFDFGGVFTTSPVEHFALYEQEHGLPEQFIGRVIKHNHHTNAWAKFERAEISRDAFDVDFAAETRAAGFEVRGETLLSLLRLELNNAMMMAHRRIRDEGYLTGCITNNLPDMDNDTLIVDAEARQVVADVMDSFDAVIESSKVGIRKPEPAIYQMMCDQLGVEASECVFLDDLGINLKPARAMGMATIKVPFGNVQPAIDELFHLLDMPAPHTAPRDKP